MRADQRASGAGRAGAVYHRNPKYIWVGILSGYEFFYPAVEGFKAKMAKLGYVEGENIVYDVQTAPVDVEAYRTIANKFVNDHAGVAASLSSA